MAFEAAVNGAGEGCYLLLAVLRSCAVMGAQNGLAGGSRMLGAGWLVALVSQMP